MVSSVDTAATTNPNAATTGRPGASDMQMRPRTPEGALAAAPRRQWLMPRVDETFRSIYTRAGIGASETLAVCSALAGEGRTTVGLGLAVALAQDMPDRQILLVETDFAAPILAKDFDAESSPGIVECLVSGETVELAYRETFLENLQIAVAGEATPMRSRLLRSGNMIEALETMRQTHDILILDTPAILTSSDGLLLTDLADGVIFVVRTGVTSQALVDRAVKQLDPSKFRGVVLNGGDSAVPGWLRRLCGI